MLIAFTKNLPASPGGSWSPGRIVLEAHQAGDLACDALRPRRQVLAADREIRRPLQDGDRVERIGNINALRGGHPARGPRARDITS
jgi:hypothetical protein